MNKERLLILATFLETMVPPEQWDYMSVVGLDWKGAQDLSCGTTGCAIGWAASVPVLRKAGMKLIGYKSQYSNGWAIDSPLTFQKARDVFGLTLKEAIYLFQPGEREIGRSGLPRTATAAEVAKHIRRFVKRGGIPGEVVGYAVKMCRPGWADEWRPSNAENKREKMSLEEATKLADLVPYNRTTKRGRKVVRLVRRSKKK